MNENFRSIYKTIVPDIETWDHTYFGSTDIGNVSEHIPTLHSYLSISSRPIDAHTKAFALQTLTREALECVKKGIKALALFCIYNFNHPALIDNYKMELDSIVRRKCSHDRLV